MRTYAETVAQWNEISLNEVKGKVTFKPIDGEPRWVLAACGGHTELWAIDMSPEEVREAVRRWCRKLERKERAEKTIEAWEEIMEGEHEVHAKRRGYRQGPPYYFGGSDHNDDRLSFDYVEDDEEDENENEEGELIEVTDGGAVELWRTNLPLEEVRARIAEWYENLDSAV